MLRFDRKKQNSVKKLSFNKKKRTTTRGGVLVGVPGAKDTRSDTSISQLDLWLECNFLELREILISETLESATSDS